MKRTTIHILLLCLSLIFLTNTACKRSIESPESTEQPATLSATNQPLALAAAGPCFLEAKGTQIVNSSGQNVLLKTINLGYWLIQEGYMLNPGNGNMVPCQWKMKQLYKNQGKSEAEIEAFYQSWRNNFITKADIDYLASLGFNSVRLPMHYELFLTSAQRSVRNAVAFAANETDRGNKHDTYKNSLQSWYNGNQLFNDGNLEGFRIIDNLLSWCGANNMHVILDLHAAPGGQGSDQNINDNFYGNNLWQFAVFQDVTTRLWERIAQRYKADARIAFYDLINEPHNVPGGGPVMKSLYQRLITAIRNSGDNHMLMIEGNGYGNEYSYLEPNNFSPRWGLVYNAHRYWHDLNTDYTANPNPNQINLIANINNFRNTHQVPVWVGETGENNNSWLSQNIAQLNQANIGWAHWTYKRHDWTENAALLRIGGNYPTDGASVMASVLENIKFANCIKNNNTIAAVTSTLPPARSGVCGGGGSSSGTVPIGKTIWIKGNNGKYISSEGGGNNKMTCSRSDLAATQKFVVVDAGGGKIALRGSNGKYVSSENGAQAGMTCNRDNYNGAWEQFTWQDKGNGLFAISGVGGFVSSENGLKPITCYRADGNNTWEIFTWGQ